MNDKMFTRWHGRHDGGLHLDEDVENNYDDDDDSQLKSIFSYLTPLRSEMTISEMSSIDCPIPS